MTNQDGEPLKTANPSSCAPAPKHASTATTPGEKTPPLTVVAAQTADNNLVNENPEIPTTLLNGKRQPNFRIPPRLLNYITATTNPTKSVKTAKLSSCIG